MRSFCMYIYDVSLEVLLLDYEESQYSSGFSFCRQHVGGMGYLHLGNGWYHCAQSLV